MAEEVFSVDSDRAVLKDEPLLNGLSELQTKQVCCSARWCTSRDFYLCGCFVVEIHVQSLMAEFNLKKNVSFSECSCS